MAHHWTAQAAFTDHLAEQIVKQGNALTHSRGPSTTSLDGANAVILRNITTCGAATWASAWALSRGRRPFNKGSSDASYCSSIICYYHIEGWIVHQSVLLLGDLLGR